MELQGLSLQRKKEAAWTAAILSFVDSIPVALHKYCGKIKFFGSSGIVVELQEWR